MKTLFKNNYLQLLLLALVFVLPGLAAWQFYKHPQWLGQASTNKGQLLDLPERIALPGNKSRWRLILWNPKDCETACRQQLDTLARVRLALGRRLYEVDVWLLQNNTTPIAESLLVSLKEQDIQRFSLPSSEQIKYKTLDDSAKIFVANPDNYLILAYPTTVNPKSIYDDIKHLLLSNGK